MNSAKINHDCKRELQNIQLKATPARLGVLKALETTTKPLDVASLLHFLKKQNIKVDKVTVFRIMNILSEKGLVIPIQLGEGKFRYELSGRADHHHFICETCSDIFDISDCRVDRLESEIKKKKGLLVKRHSLEFFGICKQCQR